MHKGKLFLLYSISTNRAAEMLHTGPLTVAQAIIWAELEKMWRNTRKFVTDHCFPSEKREW